MDQNFFIKLKQQFPNFKKRIESIENDLRQTDLILDLGYDLMQKEAYNQAVDCFEYVLQNVKNDYESMLNLALIKYRQNELQQALELFNKTSSFHPEQPTAWMNAGYIAFQLGKKEEGFSALNKVIELDKSNGAVCEVLSYYALINGKYDDCIRVGKLAAQRGKPGYGFLYSGVAKLIKGNEQEGVKLILASFWGFESKSKYFEELDECKDLINASGNFGELRDEVKHHIAAVEGLGPQDQKSIYTFWSAGINVTENEKTAENLKRLKDLGYPSILLDWLELGDHTYSSEVISGDIGEGFMFDIFNSSDILKHLAKADVDLLYSCGFLIFGHEAYDEYYLLDKHDNFKVYRVFESPAFGEKIPPIEEIVDILKLSNKNDWAAMRNFMLVHFLRIDSSYDQYDQFLAAKSKIILDYNRKQ